MNRYMIVVAMGLALALAGCDKSSEECAKGCASPAYKQQRIDYCEFTVKQQAAPAEPTQAQLDACKAQPDLVGIIVPNADGIDSCVCIPTI